MKKHPTFKPLVRTRKKLKQLYSWNLNS